MFLTNLKGEIMKTFTAFEWLLIDIGTQFGLDKEVFEKRLDWAKENIDSLEAIGDKAQWKEKPLYIKAVMALRKVQKGLPTGHMIGCDSTASGVQIMSAITGCHAGALATGLIDPEVRADVYTSSTAVMNQTLHSKGITVDVSRANMKQAVMCSFYGSKLEPEMLFGKDTEELECFYQTMEKVAPGAWELRKDLLEAWQPYALSHEWQLPDGFEAKVKVMQQVTTAGGNLPRIEIDELEHYQFGYTYYENKGSKKGLSLVANAVHSIDGYIVRTMHRKCNYDATVVRAAYAAICNAIGKSKANPIGKVKYYIDQYERSSIADVVILPWIADGSALSDKHLEKLKVLCEQMLQHKSFPIVTIHDSFACHAGNVDQMRFHYKETLADLADSEILSDLFGQIYRCKIEYNKLSNDLGDKIRNSNYAIC